MRSVNTNENDPMNWEYTVRRTSPVLRTKPINFKCRSKYYKNRGLPVPPIFKNCTSPQKRSTINRINRAKDPYKVLGIPIDSTRSIIRKRFLKLSKQYHPDKRGGNANTFKKIKNAYNAIISR